LSLAVLNFVPEKKPQITTSVKQKVQIIIIIIIIVIIFKEVSITFNLRDT